MSRAELIVQLSDTFPEMRGYEIERAVDVVFESVVVALEKGQRVELRGFGAFTVRHRQERLGRNPRTGAKVDVKSTHVPFFKTGKELRALLNAPERNK